MLAKAVAKHLPKQLVGLYKLVWGPAQGVRHHLPHHLPPTFSVLVPEG